MFVPKIASHTLHFAAPEAVSNAPRELVFADVALAPPVSVEDDRLREHTREYYSVANPTCTSADYFTTRWNSGFHTGESRDHQAFVGWCPAIKGVRNRNTTFVPRVSGYSELHGLLAALCPDDVLARHRLSRHPVSFLLSPLSIPRNQNETDEMFDLRLRAEAEACALAFRDYAWGRLIRGTRGDYSSKSSVRVLIDDSSFWMNAAYRAATKRARSLLRPLGGIMPAEFMDHARMKEFLGYLMPVPPFGPEERAEVRFDGDRIRFRIGRLVRETRHDSNQSGGLMDDLGPNTGFFLSGNSLEELMHRRRDMESHRFQPRTPEFTDTGLVLLPVLGEGELWNLADPGGREEAFSELFGRDEQDSLEPILRVLQRDVLPEDLRDKGWSHLKEDLHRKFYRKARKGQKRVQVVCVETLDEFPVADPSALLVEEDELLRSVMVLLDPRERKVIVLLRLGRTQNEIASELGLADHSGVSRIIKKMEPKVRKALGSDPATPTSAKRSGNGRGRKS